MSDAYVSKISGLGTHKLFTIQRWEAEAGWVPVLFNETLFITNPEREGYFVPNFGKFVGEDIIVCSACLDEFKNIVWADKTFQGKLCKKFLDNLTAHLKSLLLLLWKFDIIGTAPKTEENFQKLPLSRQEEILNALGTLMFQLNQMNPTVPVQTTKYKISLLQALIA